MSVDYYKCEACECIRNDWEEDFKMANCQECNAEVCGDCWVNDDEVERDDCGNIPYQNCPFCTGQQTLPEQRGYVDGYLSGLKDAGLTHLTGSIAKKLTHYKYADLDFNFLKSMDIDAAIALKGQKGYLEFGRAPDPDVIEVTGEREGDAVSGGVGVKQLSDAAAESLSKRKGDLYLEGVTELSDAAVESLSKHKGTLGLNGLTELSDAAAESLSKHKGTLGLNGVTELSDAAAESLSKHKGDLGLEGVTELSDAAVESLSKHKGELGLEGVTSLSDAAAESLSKHKEILGLNGVTELSDAAAESLSKYQGYINGMDPEEWIESFKN